MPVTNPWDCHIAWLPNLRPVSALTTTDRKNNLLTVDTASASNPIGGLSAVAQFNSGQPVDWTVFAGANTSLATLGIDPSYLSGDCRLVGIGFEVTDTSAEINKQGLITAYAYPQGGPEDVYSQNPA